MRFFFNLLPLSLFSLPSVSTIKLRTDFDDSIFIVRVLGEVRDCGGHRLLEQTGNYPR
jgi:hypothetical protein